MDVTQKKLVGTGTARLERVADTKQREEPHEDLPQPDPSFGPFTGTSVAPPEKPRSNASLKQFAHQDFRVLTPKPDTNYAATTTHNGEELKLDVKFSADFIKSLRELNGKIDLDRGAIVVDGHSTPLFRTGTPWLMEFPGNVTGVPKALTVDGSVFQPLPIPTAVHGNKFFEIEPGEAPPELVESRYTQLETMPPVRRTVAPGVEIIAPSEELFEKAKKAFDDVAGKSSTRWEEQRARVEVEKQKLTDMLAAIMKWETPEGANLSELMPKVNALLGRTGSLGYGLAKVLLQERIDDYKMMQAPVTVVVVPEGKHWKAMQSLFPDMELPAYMRGGAFDVYSLAAVNKSPDATIAFLPADDLNGTQRDSRHELYHIVDLVYLGDSPLKKRVDEIFERTVENGGPFARVYGTTRNEFITTMGELFEGTKGPEGVAWLKNNQRELFDTFVEITGRNPLP